MTNGKPETSGYFDIQFNTQKAFTAFGNEFSTCALNFKANGQLESPPQGVGNLTS